MILRFPNLLTTTTSMIRVSTASCGLVRFPSNVGGFNGSTSDIKTFEPHTLQSLARWLMQSPYAVQVISHIPSLASTHGSDTPSPPPSHAPPSLPSFSLVRPVSQSAGSLCLFLVLRRFMPLHGVRGIDSSARRARRFAQGRRGRGGGRGEGEGRREEEGAWCISRTVCHLAESGHAGQV